MKVSIIGLGFVGFLTLGKKFICMWIGAEYSSVWMLTLIMVTPLMLSMTQSFGISILIAKNKYKMRAIMLLCVGAISAIVGYLLSLMWGAKGAALGTGLALLLGPGLAMNIYYYFKIGLNIPRFMRKVWGAMLLPLLICGVSGALISRYLPGDDWYGFFCKGGVLTLFYAVIMWLLFMNRDERRIILDLLPRVRGK